MRSINLIELFFDIEYLENLSNTSEQVAFIAGKDGEQFLCVMKDGAIEYISFPEDHRLVQEFKEIERKKYKFHMIQNVKE